MATRLLLSSCRSNRGSVVLSTGAVDRSCHVVKGTRERQSQLAKLRADIFQNIHNETSERRGNKYLKKSLKGPTLLDYYREPFYASKLFCQLLRQHTGVHIQDPLIVYKLRSGEVSVGELVRLGRTSLPHDMAETPTLDHASKTVPGLRSALFSTPTEGTLTLSSPAVPSVPASLAEILRERTHWPVNMHLTQIPVDERIYYKFARTRQLRERGRGAPKKGHGKRASLKRK